MIKYGNKRVSVTLPEHLYVVWKGTRDQQQPDMSFSEFVTYMIILYIQGFKEHDVGSGPSEIPRGSGEAASGHVD